MYGGKWLPCGYPELNRHAEVQESARPADAGLFRVLDSSWEVARRYGFTDYDGRRPDWGRHAIDWSVLPPPLVELFRTGTALQLAWLSTLADRTRRFLDKMPRM